MYHQCPFDEFLALNSKSFVVLLKIMKVSSGLIKLPMTLLDCFHFWLSCITVTVKLQTMHLHFVPEGGNSQLNLLMIMSLLYLSSLWRNYPPTVLLLNLMMLLLPLILLHDSYNPDEPDPKPLHQCMQILKCQSGHLRRTEMFTCKFGPKQVPNSATRLSYKKHKSKHAIILGLYW